MKFPHRVSFPQVVDSDANREIQIKYAEANANAVVRRAQAEAEGIQALYDAGMYLYVCMYV